MSEAHEHAPGGLSGSDALELRRRLDDVMGTLAYIRPEVDATRRLLERTKESKERMGLSPLASRILGRLALEYGLESEDALLKALGLLSRALEAERDGQKIAILDPDDTIVGEIGGFQVPLALPSAS